MKATETRKPLAVGDALVGIHLFYGIGQSTPTIIPVTVLSIGKRDVKVVADQTQCTYVFRVDDPNREARNASIGSLSFYDPDEEIVARARVQIARNDVKNNLRKHIEATERHLRGYDETFDAQSLRAAIDAYEAILDEPED